MCPLGAVVTMTGAYVLSFTAILLIKSGADWLSGKCFGICAERSLVLLSVMSLFNVALKGNITIVYAHASSATSPFRAGFYTFVTRNF